MLALSISQIPYIVDGAVFFAPLAHRDMAIFFDSGPAHHRQGRFDIISCEPKHRITAISNQTLVDDKKTELDCFNATKSLLEHYQLAPSPQLQTFSIGALGYFGYDCARQLESLPAIAKSDLTLPQTCVGIYLWSIVSDHQTQCSYFIKHPQCSMTFEKIQQWQALPQQPFQLSSDFTANMTYAQYEKKFKQIKQHIRYGDCYQINLCQRFHAAYQGDPWQAYTSIRAANATPFACYMNLGDDAILSFSPERFIEVRNGMAESKPIKGTIPRGKSAASDKANATTLMQSKKDRAENIMITDLLRNDFGRCCTAGSIQVPKLCALESFSNVHHLVSTVVGKLAPHISALDLLKSAFPGGSITGAPKIRTMQIIETLEPQRRSVYCGSLGYFDIYGNMDCNIAIRTLILNQRNIYINAGGGIVADSQCDAEYQETFDKVTHLMQQLKAI